MKIDLFSAMQISMTVPPLGGFVIDFRTRSCVITNNTSPKAKTKGKGIL